jgi:hypothetical protein
MAADGAAAPAAALLASLLARRGGPAAANDGGPPPPSWRREEQWRCDAAAARAGAELGRAFVYEWEPGAARGAALRLPEVHDHVGTRVWDAAVLLSRSLEHRVAGGDLCLRGARVLELGAGTGLCGLVAARLGDARTRVLCTDQPALVAQLGHNAAANAEAARVEGAPCTWGDEAHHAALDARLRQWAAEAAAAAAAEAAAGAPDGAVAASAPATPLLPQQQQQPLPPPPPPPPPRPLLDLIIACDMAAPAKSVPDFMATLAHFLPPSPPPPQEAAHDEEAEEEEGEDEGGEQAAVTAAGRLRGGAAVPPPPPPPPLPPPELLLCAQLHRDFTAPLLAACRARYDVLDEGDALMHPRFRSPRHVLLRVRARWAAGVGAQQRL